MKFILSNEQLQKFIPNTITTVKGETCLYDKILPFLAVAEEWFVENIISEDVANAILQDSCELLDVIRQGVVYDAFASAIPSLDLILTANGFGIVNNANVVPASKDRVERLIESLINMRDKVIENLLSELRRNDLWLDTDQARWFRSTMFPTLAITDILGVGSHRFDAFVATREQLMSIETNISVAFIGDELFSELRKEAQTGIFAPMHEGIVKMLQAVEVRLLKDSTNSTHFNSSFVPSHDLRHIVNIIRNHPEGFPAWHNSEVAKLFEPPIYENKKRDGGFWF